MSNDSKGITCVTLEGDDRVHYPAALFGVAFGVRLEPLIFTFAEALSPDYSGGLWKFFRIESEQQGFLMVPEPEDKRYRVRVPNGYDGEMTAEAFGITVCLYSFSHAAFQGGPFGETCSECFHLLRAFAAEHPEADAIFRAID